MFKKFISCVLLFGLLQPFAFANTTENKQLIFAIDLIRHGDRTPIIEIPKSVTEAIGSVIVTENERKEAHKALYSGDKILEIQNLKTWFPATKSFFGRSKTTITSIDNNKYLQYCLNFIESIF